MRVIALVAPVDQLHPVSDFLLLCFYKQHSEFWYFSDLRTNYILCPFLDLFSSVTNKNLDFGTSMDFSMNEQHSDSLSFLRPSETTTFFARNLCTPESTFYFLSICLYLYTITTTTFRVTAESKMVWKKLLPYILNFKKSI